MHRALETPVIQLLVFEELDSASSLMACSKVCRKWHDEAMFIRVKNHPVSLLGLIQTISPILRNASNGLGGHFAALAVPTDRQAMMSLNSRRLIGIGANVRSIFFDVALDPCSITLIRGLTRRHNGPIFSRLSSLTIPRMIEQWDITSNLSTFDFLLSISSPITTVTFADGCGCGYARSMMEFFALSQLPISRLRRGRLSNEDEYPETIGYKFLWHVSRIELHHPPMVEEWIELSKCEKLEELIIREPLPWIDIFGLTMTTFGHLQSLEVPWTLLPLLENTIIPKLKRFTLGSAGVPSNEGPILLRKAVLSALASHSPDLQELRIHDIFFPEIDVLRPILSLKNIKVLELLNADWDDVRDKDIETIARSFPLLQTFAFRDRGPDWCKRMLTAASVLALARNCKALVRVELPLSLKTQESAKFKVAPEDRMRCLRCLRIEVQFRADRGLLAFLASVMQLCPSLVDFIIKTTDESCDGYWMELFYMAVAKARTVDCHGMEPKSSGKRSREVFLNLGNSR
ncbi:hypothetical protein FRC04_000810 [Tulasnella sp. 424]|nr:hypothetical protein FRC04_000810 [Tulasnella sp. 424]KAG8965616.1 hypothetical protein FRC05_003210 [Tulasnella sp. 425]